MSFVSQYTDQPLKREELDETEGALVVEFGTNWCGHCQAAQPFIGEALSEYPSVRHLKIEDGKGRRLGRTFGVKLWPTLVFLRGGKEVARVVRPTGARHISEGLNAATGS